VEGFPQSHASYEAQSATHLLQDKGCKSGENQNPQQRVAEIASCQSTGGDSAGPYKGSGDDESRPRPHDASYGPGEMTST